MYIYMYICIYIYDWLIDTLGDVYYNVVAAIVAIIITNIMIECIRGTYSQTKQHPTQQSLWKFSVPGAQRLGGGECGCLMGVWPTTNPYCIIYKQYNR